MDDVLGHCGFLAGSDGKPWGGATVQVNCSLKLPIRVGSTLLVSATVVGREGKTGRKVRISGKLQSEKECHALLDGLTVVGVDLPPGTDIAGTQPQRRWVTEGEDHKASGWGS
jgi:hypothetical protein